MAPESTVAARVAQLVECFSTSAADPAWLLCDRHPGDAVAFTVVEPDGSWTDLTFGQLRERSERFAGVLKNLGVGRGDRVATLMGKSADLVTVLLGSWRIGAVYVPLFTAFAADAVSARLTASGAKVVVADTAQRSKVPAGDWAVLVAGSAEEQPDGTHRLAEFMVSANRVTGSVPIGGDGALVHMFTSGTTGAPKGVVHPLRYVAGWQAYLEFALGVRGDSVYWCGADPGWAYGLYAAVVAPMSLGVRSVLQRGGFDVAATWATLAALGVTDFAAAPTVYRALRGGEVPADLHLRRLSSAGEPLTAEVNEWAEPALGLAVHDHYGQTEVGMVVGYPHHADLEIAVVPQTMGVALPGWAVTVLKEGTSEPAAAGEPGLLAIDVTGSPLMTFTGYAGGCSATGRFTADGAYYLTGDLAGRGEDGTLRFCSRDDDVIIMAGYRIGPFDVESVLAQHEAVAECAVVAAPDPVRGEVVEAFVVLRPDVPVGAGLEQELQTHVKQRYAAHAYPRRVHFVESLPKTPSGKIQRAQLRAVLSPAAP